MRTVTLLLGFLFIAAIGTFASPSSSHAGSGGGCSGSAGSDVNRAGLVVSFGGERPTQRFCVEFTEESISGIELLRRSGLNLVTQIEGGLGAGVCAIDGVGSDDPTDCFKYSTTPPYRYWVYFRWTETAWQFSNVGASTRVIHDGDIDGWSWGNGAGAPPEAHAGVLDTPTPTPVPPTATPTPVQPTATREPAMTRTATSTPVPDEAALPATLAPNVTPPPSPAAQSPLSTAQPSNNGSARAPTAPVPADADVAGALATPRDATTVAGTGTPSPGTRTPVASPTARTGVIVVDPTKAHENEATAEETQGDTSGGGSSALIGFAVVAAALAGGAGMLLYRRRGHDV